MNQPITTEWSLEILNQIFGTWGTPAVTCLPQSTIRIFPSSCLQFRSLKHRCSVTRLAGEVNVHVSNLPPAQLSHSEAQDHPGGRTNNPLMAFTTVVPTSTTSVCEPPSFLSLSPEPTVTTGICLERQVIPSAHMEALMQHFQAAGFSKEVSSLTAAPRSFSTNKMYDDRWLCFTHWATGQGIVNFIFMSNLT